LASLLWEVCQDFCRKDLGRHDTPEVFFSISVSEAIGTAATPGLLYQPRVIVKMIVEKQMECRLAGETEVLLVENLPQRHFAHHKIPHDQTRV
jgi:hypothetical protein